MTLTDADHAWLAAHPVIRIQMSRDSPPFEFRLPDGTPQGLSYDTLQLLCGRLGLKLQVTDLDWSTALAAIQAVKPPVDLLLGVTRSDERRRQMALTHVYTSFPYVIFTTKQHPFVGDLGDLWHATVVVEKDDVMEAWLRRDLPHARLLTFKTNGEVLQAVAEGRADAYVGNLGIGSYTIQSHGLLDLKVAAPAPYGQDAYCFGVRRDWPQLVALLNRALATLTPEDQADLHVRWLQVRYDHGLRWQDVLAGVLAVALLALAFILQLRRMVQRRTRELAAEVGSHRATEEQLRRSLKEQEDTRRQLADILEFLPDPTLVLDQDRRVIAWNRAMETLTGVPKAKMLGQGDQAYAVPFYGDRRPVLADQVMDKASDPAATLAESGGHWAQGSVPVHGAQIFVPALHHGRGAWLYGTASALFDSQGRLAGVVETIREVTEQKALEAQLAQSQRLEAIGTLAGGIAHDFNNILSAVAGYAELALTRAPEPDLAEDLRGILAASGRASDLVKQILAFSRVRPEEPQLFKPAPLVAEALKLLRATVPTTVAFDLALRSEASVLADPAEIHRIVVNLCTNATLAMNSRGRLGVALDDLRPDAALRAEVAGLEDQPYVRFSVSDNGAGMSPEVLAHIFDPFFTTRGDRGGSGMGLAVVYGIVRSRGGAIQASSRVGQGSTVRVYLPAVPVPAPGPLLARAEPSPGHGRLLLVDDEPMIADVLSRSLRRKGYSVEAFTVSQEALQRFQEAPDAFDLLITDRSMPGLTGLELAARVKALRPGLPVLLCTGYDEDDVGKTSGHGVDQVLTKPVTATTLSEHILRMLG